MRSEQQAGKYLMPAALRLHPKDAERFERMARSVGLRKGALLRLIVLDALDRWERGELTINIVRLREAGYDEHE